MLTGLAWEAVSLWEATLMAFQVVVYKAKMSKCTKRRRGEAKERKKKAKEKKKGKRGRDLAMKEMMASAVGPGASSWRWWPTAGRT